MSERFVKCHECGRRYWEYNLGHIGCPQLECVSERVKRKLMTEKYQPKTGDRVRVVLEGEVTLGAAGWFSLGKTEVSNLIRPQSAHVVSIEKLQDPEPKWEPGDLVAVRRAQPIKGVPLYTYYARTKRGEWELVADGYNETEDRLISEAWKEGRLERVTK